MANETVQSITSSLDNMKVESTFMHPLVKDKVDDCEAAEEGITTDSEDYLSEPLRYCNFQYPSSNDSSITLTPRCTNGMEEDNYSIYSSIEIPIVGYEVMEERARFTVFKLRIENKVTGDSWYVFRRYTDFVRLCNKLKHSHPNVVNRLPQKKWIGNNFDPVFLEERLHGLQTLVNGIITEGDLLSLPLIQDFFCLSEPPTYTETNQESRVMLEAFEETVYQLKKQLREKEATVDILQESLHTKTLETDNLKKIIRESTKSCQKCQKDYENISKSLHISLGAAYTHSTNSPCSSTSSEP